MSAYCDNRMFRYAKKAKVECRGIAPPHIGNYRDASALLVIADRSIHACRRRLNAMWHPDCYCRIGSDDSIELRDEVIIFLGVRQNLTVFEVMDVEMQISTFVFDRSCFVEWNQRCGYGVFRLQ